MIRALDDEIEHRFRDAFSEVAEAYQRYFAVLFPAVGAGSGLPIPRTHIPG